LKRYTSPGTDEILAELIQAGGEILLSGSINSLILFGIGKLPGQWKESIVVPRQNYW
jgi:hypothetical protein